MKRADTAWRCMNKRIASSVKLSRLVAGGLAYSRGDVPTTLQVYEYSFVKLKSLPSSSEYRPLGALQEYVQMTTLVGGATLPDLSPIILDGPEAIDWTDEADVVVVGFGGAGVAAALEARERGADVLAIDRFRGGGATAFSGGTYYAGGGTAYQREAGVQDTPDEMFKYLMAEECVVAPDTLRRFCEGSSADLDWVDRHGVPHGSTLYHGKTAFPPPGFWLFYSGNELLPKYKDSAKPAPRGHRVRSAGTGGNLHYGKLREAALGIGVRLKMHAPVRRLVIDRTGRVLGVEVNVMPEALWTERERIYKKVSPWRPFNSERAQGAISEMQELETKTKNHQFIRARQGVILSTGGFVYNLEMLKQNREILGRNYEGLLRLGSLGCDGSGILLGQTVGGRTGCMDRYFLGRPLSPPESFVRGLMVNLEGRRFVNEDAYQSVFGDYLVKQPEEGRAWLILDRRQFWRGIRQILLPAGLKYRQYAFLSLLNVMMGGTKWSMTLKGLAGKCRIAPVGLAQTFADYNRRVTDHQPDELGKSPSNVEFLGGGPYYAVNVSLNNRYGPTFCFSLGGLEVNEDTGEVRKQDGAVIPGLYAAGRAAVGLCSGGYMTGMSIADTVFSGRRAAKHAVGCMASRRATLPDAIRFPAMPVDK